MPDPNPQTVPITVTLNHDQNGMSASYSSTANGIVNDQGNIDLRPLGAGGVTLQFTLANNAWLSGDQSFVAKFAESPRDAIQIGENGGTPRPYPTGESEFGDFSRTNDGNTASVTDMDNDGAVYSYCLHLIEVDGNGNSQPIALDPQIVNRDI